MTKRGGQGGRRHAGLTPDEEDLWRHVVERVHPLRRARPSSDIHQSDPTDGADAPRVPADDKPTVVRQPRRWQPLVTTPVPKLPLTPHVGDGFDRKRLKRIATGRIEIEARLDLHGLRESEAHMRLRGFLRQAQAQGKRTVLVITGKGRIDDDPSTPFDFGADRTPRGVLKRNVPRWLTEPDIAGLVVSFTTAHTRHGGEGALYVHLRR